MPFDSTVIDRVVTDNTLKSIGLVPVPSRVVQRHKATVLELFQAQSSLNRSLVRQGLAKWKRRLVMRSADGSVTNQTIKRALTLDTVMTPDPTAPPDAIVDIVKTVHQQIEKSEFTIEYFYDDPIVNVEYTDATGKFHRDCLGIWDNGKVIAIASSTTGRIGWMSWVWDSIC